MNNHSTPTGPELPQRTSADVAHSVAKGLIGALPLAGSVAAELFNELIAPPLQRRRDEWFAGLLNKLEALKDELPEEVFKRLPANESFVTAVTTASTIAVKNHSKTKLEALRNIIANEARKPNPNADVSALYLNLIDQFSELHIRLLKIFFEGFVWFTPKNRFPEKDIPEMLVASVGSYKDLRELDRDLIGVCLADLMRNNLVQHWRITKVTERHHSDSFFCDTEWVNRKGTRMTVKHGPAIKVHAKEGALLLRTSHFGQGLVYFISDPKRSSSQS